MLALKSLPVNVDSILHRNFVKRQNNLMSAVYTYIFISLLIVTFLNAKFMQCRNTTLNLMYHKWVKTTKF